jgi:hypothetical protein
VDWDGLEMALTWRLDEGGYFLDVTTGEVIAWTGVDDEWTEEEIDAGLDERRLLKIECLPSSVQYRWMEDFTDSATGGELRRLLVVALDGPGAFRRFKDVLVRHPADRERWFAYQRGRALASARDWLAQNGIEPTTEPRRRPQS